MENQNSRKPQINVEANQTLVDELRRVSDITQVPYSQIVREAIWAKIAEIKQSHPAFQVTEQQSALNK